MSEQQSIRDELAREVIHAMHAARWTIASKTAREVSEYLLASPVIRHIQADALRDARRKLNEHLLNAHGAGYSDYGLQFLHQEADRIERGG